MLIAERNTPISLIGKKFIIQDDKEIFRRENSHRLPMLLIYHSHTIS